MADDIESPNSERAPTGESAGAGESAGTAQMLALMAAEIERLKANLELIRGSDAPNRRALIKAHVERIDERQDALESLRALQNSAATQD